MKNKHPRNKTQLEQMAKKLGMWLEKSGEHTHKRKHNLWELWKKNVDGPAISFCTLSAVEKFLLKNGGENVKRRITKKTMTETIVVPVTGEMKNAVMAYSEAHGTTIAGIGRIAISDFLEKG